MRKLILALIMTALSFTIAWAGDPEPTILTNKEAIDLVQSHTNYLWTLVAACLVFFMQAGFAMVEAGFTRAKNAVNFLLQPSKCFWPAGFGPVRCRRVRGRRSIDRGARPRRSGHAPWV